MLALLLAGLALCQSAPAPETLPVEPVDSVAWARIEQDALPAWAARAEAASRRVTAREAWFSGERAFDVAWPGLVDTRLTHPAVVRGRLAALQAAATARETERLAELPPLTEEQQTLLTTARDGALDAEDRADALERRLLTRVLALLTAHPEITDPILAPQLAPQRALLAAPVPDDEEAAARHAEQAQRADAAIRRTEDLQRALLLHGLGEPDLPAPDADLASLATGDALVVTRLWMLASHLPDTERARLDAALAAFQSGEVRTEAEADVAAARRELEEAAVAAVEADAAALEADVDERTAELDRLERILAGLPEGHPLVLLRTLERNAARDRKLAAERRLERLRSGQVARSEAAAAAAAKARRQAEEAAEAAEGDAAQLRALVLDRAADASERLQLLTQTIDAKAAAIEARQTAHAERMLEAKAVLAEVRDASPLPGSGPDADKLYTQLRHDIEELAESDVAAGELENLAREQIAEVRVRTADERQELAGIERTYAIADPLDEWSETLDAERELADELLVLARNERREVLRAIREIGALRRDLRPYVSWRQNEIDGSRMPTEILAELRLLEPTVVGAFTNRTSEIVSSPWRLIRDGRLMVDLVSSVFFTILLLAGWFWARGKAAGIASRLAWQVRRVRPDLKPTDLHEMKGPLAVAIRAAIDLGLGYLMVGRLSWISGEIAFLVECWLLLAVYRLFMGTFDVAFVKSPDFRPCLAAMAPATYDLARTTARIVVIWGIARGFTTYIVWGVLGMDATTTFLMTLFNFAGWIAAAALLYVWDPLLRERVRARNQESRAVQFLARDVPWPLRPLAALAMLGFFATTLVVDVTYWLLARDRTGLARVFNVISRYQMEEASPDQRSLSPEKKTELCAPGTVYVKRPGIDEACNESLTGWAREGRRGMVAMIGDRGDGKRTELDRFIDRLDDPELAIVRQRMGELHVEPGDLVRWLCALADVPSTRDTDTLIEHLRGLPRTVFVVEQAHRTFSRTVGGFDAIQTFLYVLNATSDHHFWMVTFHRPAWRYLSSVPSVVDVGVFRSVINLEPFTPVALRELAERRARIAGLTLDYQSLMRANLLGADPRVELQRAIDTFYRLLSDASEGNPRVAMHLFADCLEPSADDPTLVYVQRRRALATDVVAELGVNALFALVALRQQDAMALPEIVDVTNLPESSLRNIVRDLQSRGLVEANGTTLYIPIHLLPLVSRTLRRRHLLNLGG